MPDESPKAPLAPLPLDQLKAAAQDALDEVLAIRGRAEMEAALCAVDDLAAAQLARGLREMGVDAKCHLSMPTTLRVATPMRPAFARLMAGLVEARIASREQMRGWSRRRLLPRRRIPPARCCATIIEQHPGHLPEALLCVGNCAELGSILRGEKDAVQVLVLRDRRGVARSILWRRPLHQPLARGHRRRGAARAARSSAGRARPAHSRNRRGHRRARLASPAAARARLAFLHFQRCLGGIFLRRRAEAGRVSRGGVQDFRSRKTGRRAGIRSGLVRLHYRHQCAARGERRARRFATTCTGCSRPAAASFSWTRRRRNSGPRRFSA